jgi:hypothetical protein
MILLALLEAMPNQPPKPPCDPPREPLIIRVPPSQIRLPEQEPTGPPDEPEMELPDEPFWIPPEMPPPPHPEDRADQSLRLVTGVARGRSHATAGVENLLYVLFQKSRMRQCDIRTERAPPATSHASRRAF